MTRNLRRRSLSFEQLEHKASPTSLLLMMTSEGADRASWSQVATAEGAVEVGAWRYDHETITLLRFIHDCTPGPAHHFSSALPAQASCDVADVMMRLDDVELRSMVALGAGDIS